MRNRVRELRSEAGMTQADLGEALGVSRQTINSIESGRYLPSLPLAFRIARLFEVDLERIFETEEADR
jgi:putative transcriptional regulator